ncbi:Ff.00g090010.m01.CDS01 [Fusarium sp. VM40]|nr:Ff.00g090010.m01.CDS01 [Fusarium sp. VM40]
MGRAPHATRHCPNAEEDAIFEWSDKPLTANDGVRRDIRAGRLPAMSDSKRHRGNKAKRHRDLSFRPESSKSSVGQEFKKA